MSPAIQALKSHVPARHAALVLLSALAGLTLVHLLVLARIVPADLVWGGRNARNIVPLELFALALTVLFALVIAVKARLVRIGTSRAATVGSWLLVVFLGLNTLGNLASSTPLETLLFTPVTIVLAILALRVALEP